MKKLEVQLLSVPDRDDLIVEIWEEDNQFAEIYVENNEMKVDIYYLNRNVYSFNLEELQQVFSEAAQLLNYQIHQSLG